MSNKQMITISILVGMYTACAIFVAAWAQSKLIPKMLQST